MLAYVLDAARAATGADPVVVVSPATAAVRDVFPDGVAFALQERPDGTGDALRAGLAAVPADADEVLVVNGDVPLIEADLLAGLLASPPRCGGDARPCLVRDVGPRPPGSRDPDAGRRARGADRRGEGRQRPTSSPSAR